MNSKFALAGLAAVLISADLFAIEVRSTSGQTMEVEVLGYTKSSGNLRIKRSVDGQIFNTKIEMFDEASRKAIEAVAPAMMPELRVDVSVGKRRAREGNSSFMKTQEISTGLKITNGSRDIDLARSKFTVLLMGRSTKRYRDREADAGIVLSKESFEQSVAAGKFVEYECKPVVTSFDSDFDDSNIGGWEYDGYVLIIQDEAGKIIDAKSNIGPVQTETLKDPEQLKKALNLNKDTVVERNLKPSGKSGL
jgi:archaellin